MVQPKGFAGRWASGIFCLVFSGCLALTVLAADQEETFPFAHVIWPEVFISQGTGAAAMGGTSATRQEAASLFGNPAGLAVLARFQTQFTHTAWVQDLAIESFWVSMPRLGISGLTLGFNYFGFGNIERTEMPFPGANPNTGSYISPYLLESSLGAGWSLSREIAAGAALESLYQDLGVRRYGNVAVTVGLQVQLPGEIELGMALKHLGFASGDYVLPSAAVIGAGWEWELAAKHSLGLALEAEWPWQAASQGLYRGGMEYRYDETLALRGGYQFSDTSGLGGSSGPTAGAGWQLGAWEIGYALTLQGALGMAHRVSLSLDWDTLGEEQRKAARNQAKSGGAFKSEPRSELSQRNARMASKEELVPTNPAQRHSLPPVAGSGNLQGSIDPAEAQMRALLRANLQVKIEIQRELSRPKEATVIFNLTRAAGPRVARWQLRLETAGGKAVYRDSGPGFPERIIWNGKDNQGIPVRNPEALKYALELTDLQQEVEIQQGWIAAEPEASETPREPSKPAVRNVHANPVYFENRGADINAEGNESVAAAAKLILAIPGATVLIEGYCDPAEEKESAVLLAKARAEAVSRHLTAYHQVPISRILLKARGVPPDVSPTPRNNRRVDITLVQGAPALPAK